jgi:hypothetical protein
LESGPVPLLRLGEDEQERLEGRRLGVEKEGTEERWDVAGME